LALAQLQLNLDGVKKQVGERRMDRSKIAFIMAGALGLVAAGPAASQGLVTEHRLSAPLVSEALAAAVAMCATQGYKVSAVVVDTDGVRQGTLRGDGASVHTLDSSYLKAYTAMTYREDSIVLAERLKGAPMPPLQMKLPNVAFAGGGVVIKVDAETIGAIGVGGAPGGEKDTACARAGLDKIKDRMK
jgi:uncharacterized protein GlcG (DUF336 family)